MRKTLCVFITCYLLSLPFYGQNQKAVDSLLQITESNISEQEKVDAYLQIAFEHVGSDSTGSNFYVDKALEIAERIGYEEGKMDALYVQGRSSLLSGDYSTSEKFLEQLAEDANRLNYPKGIADAAYGFGWLSYYHGEYDKSIAYHLKALEIRKTLASKIDISDCLRGIGITYKLMGEFDLGLDYLEQSLAIEKEISNTGGVATTLNHIGIINSLRGDYLTAMDIYFEALEIHERLGDKSGLAYTLQNIGVIYDQQKDYEQALEYYKRSLKLREEIKERRGVAQIINNIGIVYHKLGDYERALTQYHDALEIKESLGDKRGVADGNLNIGKLYADQKNHQEAVKYKLKSLEIANETNSDWSKVEALISLGRSYQDIRQYNTAKKYLLRGIQTAENARLVQSVRDGAEVLSYVERDLGNYKDAYEAHVLFQIMADSLSNEETTRRITLLQAQYEFRQEKDSIQFANEKEKLLLDQRITVQRNTQFATFFILILLVMAIIVLVRYYRLKNDSNKRLSQLNSEIQERNKSLSALNDEKNNLISIVAHDLQNPLSGIMGAIDLMDDEDLQEDQRKLKDIIQVSSARMSRMISEILDIEAIEENAEEIHLEPHNLSVAVEEVCRQFDKTASMKEINLEMSLESEIHAIVDKRYASQIIENLISNAIKFSPLRKKVEVRLSRKENKAVLEIRDEGPGLNAEDKSKVFQKFQRLSAKPTAGESSTGLGLSIVKKFVERMGGKIWVESESGKGASFYVELDLAAVEA